MIMEHHLLCQKESPASEYWEGKKVILRKLFVIIENQNCKNRMNEIRLFHYSMKYGNELNLQRTNKGIRNVHTHTHTYSHIFFCPFLSHFHHKCVLPKHALVQRPVGRSHAVLQIIVKHDEHVKTNCEDAQILTLYVWMSRRVNTFHT